MRNSKSWLVGFLGFVGVIGGGIGLKYSLVEINFSLFGSPNQAGSMLAMGASSGQNVAQPSTPLETYAPSFDCVADRGWSEQQICHDEMLSRYDRQVDTLYQQRRQQVSGQERQAIRQQEIAWLNQRTACANAADGYTCIVRLFRKRIVELGGTPG